jgi:hypothetical protein
MNTAEQRMYGMSEADIREQYMNSITARFSGLEMVVMGILSDCQELTAMGSTGQTIRQQLNIAKFILCEIQDRREAADRLADEYLDSDAHLSQVE